MNNYTRKEQERLQTDEKHEGGPSTLVQVVLDSSYGASSVDLGRYESALLVAGGSGVTFTLGLLDDIIGRCTKLGRSQGERTRKLNLLGAYNLLVTFLGKKKSLIADCYSF